jgi:hypothetical protein
MRSICPPRGPQRLLRRLSIHRTRALAAVTSDEVENIAIAVAACGVRDDSTTALRAGDGNATSETQSPFHIGGVRDIYRIAATALAAATLFMRRGRPSPSRARSTSSRRAARSSHF